MKDNLDMARGTGHPVEGNEMQRVTRLAEQEKDLENLKACYPAQVTRIRYMVEDTCDRLEYEGSPMFAELPDAVTIQKLAQEIYVKVAGEDDQMIPCIAWGDQGEPLECHNGSCHLSEAPDPGQETAVAAWNSDHGCRGPECDRPGRPGCRGPECVPPYVPRCEKGNCMLRQLIEVMLLNEMSHRRNRYRNWRR